MGVQNNLKIYGSSSGNFYGSEIRHGIFLGLNFGPGTFWGSVCSPRDVVGFLFLPAFDHLCHLKSGVLHPPPPSPTPRGTSQTQ